MVPAAVGKGLDSCPWARRAGGAGVVVIGRWLDHQVFVVAYLSAFGCAVCYGAGSVLQSVGARRLVTAGALDPRLLPRLARQLPYLIGLALDLVGWLLSLVAVRSLPLFAVQATLAGSAGVTAVLAAVFLRSRPGPAQLRALAALGVGLILLALTAQPAPPRPVGTIATIVIALFVPVLVAASAAAGRSLRGERAAVVLGALSGLAFGGTALCARALDADHTFGAVLTDPLSWALLAYGLLGLSAFGAALQRGSVTLVTASQGAAETLIPAAMGFALLGDQVRPGCLPLAAIGFVVAVAAAVELAILTPPEQPSAPPQPDLLPAVSRTR